MSPVRWWPVSAVAMGLLIVGGCKHCCKQPCPPCPCPPPACPSRAPIGGVAPPVPAPPSGLPGAMVPAPPSPAPPAPQIRGYPPLGAQVPSSPPNGTPPPDPVPQKPQTSAPQYLPEQPATAEPPPARLSPPEMPGTAPPRVREERPATPALPSGIPQFEIARDRVASGLKPLAGGFEWLALNGYKTVLHLKAPGGDDAAERRQAEQAGLKFISLEVSPQTLSRAIVDDFNRLVTDSTAQPLFVYDQGGTLTGGLWYLHFRTAERLSDEAARVRAARLGLKDEASGDAGTMWLAIQKFLRDEAR